MRQLTLYAWIGMTAILFSQGTAAATTIYFDDVIGAPVQLTNEYAANGVIFDQIERTQSFVFNIVPPSAPNYASPFWLSNNPGSIEFVDPLNAARVAFTDTVTITLVGLSTPQGHPGNYSGATIDALDIAGNVITGQTQIVNGTTTATSNIRLTFSGQVHALRFTHLDNTLGLLPFDDLTFGSLTSVPEPSSIVLLFGGAAALGLLRRQRPIG